MRNQTSFRLTTTLLPNDTTAKTTQVINKLDSNGAKFYPTFTEETVVLTNDDKTIMETTRATCTNGVLTFVKRGLSDDASATPIENRKLTWNPGTLCFITAGAGDWIDKDDDITWTGNQTYTGTLTTLSSSSATYNGILETKKGVKYPSFPTVADLEAYASPFGGMFATVDSTGELYRYNAVTEEWSVVTTAAPSNPEMASTTTIGTVRGATATEFANGTAIGSQGELLVATPAQIQSISPEVNVEVFELSSTSDTQGAQAILNAVLAGRCPIVKWTNSSYVDYYYYLYAVMSDDVTFYLPGFSKGNDSTGSYIGIQRIVIDYSGTTVTNITQGDTMKVHFSYT